MHVLGMASHQFTKTTTHKSLCRKKHFSITPESMFKKYFDKCLISFYIKRKSNWIFVIITKGWNKFEGD